MRVNLFSYIKEAIVKYFLKREYVIVTLFAFLFIGLVAQCFRLQIIKGESYLEEYTLKIQKTQEVEGTRGNIYDTNGVLLAYNQLSYSITIEDNGDYDTTTEKNAAINEVITQVIEIVESNGDEVIESFGIVLSEDGAYEFSSTEGSSSRYRFIADVYGISSTSSLTDEQKNIEPETIIEYLCAFGTSTGFGIDTETLTKAEVLQYVNIRYAMSLNSYSKYIATTIAEDIGEETKAAIMENLSELQGISIEEGSIRVYADSEYFAPILGYTGVISEEQYLEYTEADIGDYTRTDIVGKTGLELVYDSYLQGTKGEEVIYVNSLGKVIETVSTESAVAGNDLYLTLDSDLQKVAYDALEETLAGILLANIQNIMTYDETLAEDSSDIVIPIGDVYNAFFANQILTVGDFEDEDAGETEKEVLATYNEKVEIEIASLLEYLVDPDAVSYAELSDKQQEYVTYISATILKNSSGIIDGSLIDTTDEVYQKWLTDESINIYTYLNYAVSQSWIDTTLLQGYMEGSSEYSDSEEIFQAMVAYVSEQLWIDSGFEKLIYKYMILEGDITGTQISLMLFEQEIIAFNQDDYDGLVAGTITSYDFITDKIRNIEITAGQLGLEPCSGSVVITDPNTGDVLALVSYPGYDNNLLANQIDTEYYSKLVNDLSSPFYNHATLEKTAPGSTFKMVTLAAGLTEGVVGSTEIITCTSTFEKVYPSANCWIYPYSHNNLTATTALQNSCNIFFYEIGYRLGLTNRSVIGTDDIYGSTTTSYYSSSLGIDTLTEYAELFGLGEKTGLEISEASPEISDLASVPSAIGQGTHNYTTAQLARYVATIANEGTVYDLTLVDKVADISGTVIEEFENDEYTVIEEISDETWDIIKEGMELVVENNSAFDDMDDSASLAGKTGTAQQSSTSPDHALFVGYAPVDEPEIAIAVRIVNGYKSVYAASLASDLTEYYLGTMTKSEVVTGTASILSSDTIGD